MRKQYTNKNISFDDIADYVFNDVSETEERAMEDFLEEEEDYASLADDLLALNLEKGFRSKGELKSYLEKQQKETLSKFRQQSWTPKNKTSINRSTFITLFLGFITIVVAAWFYQYNQQTILPSNEVQEILKQEQQLEQKNLKQASATLHWSDYFLASKFGKSLSGLTEEMEQANLILPKSNYFRGLLTLYLYPNDLDKVMTAIHFLEKGQSYRPRRTTYHLIIAYLMADQKESALKLWKDSSFTKNDFPLSIQTLLER